MHKGVLALAFAGGVITAASGWLMWPADSSGALKPPL